jgi:myo-inositol 2-dehydrogenase / D-chiro-inositol 1-dehydrogenase
MMTAGKLRFGLVGCGAWGSHHAQAIANTPGATLAAVADSSEANRAAAQAAHPGIDVYSDWHQLIERPDIDVVDVVLPSHLHFAVGKAILESGKHLFMEKPMVLSVTEADELIALAQRKGKMLAVDHQMRLSSLWGKVKQLIDEGVVGVPQYVLVELSRFPYRLGAEGWRYDIRRVGNWILEEPIHFFDLARWYMAGFGEPLSVYARASSRQLEHPELQDNFATILNFSHGGFAVITQTLAAFEHHQTCKITGTRGAVWAWWSGAFDRTSEATFGVKFMCGDKVEEVPMAAHAGEVVELQDHIAALVAAVHEGKSPPATGVDGRWAVLMCQAAQRSVDERRPVELGACE